MTRGRRPSAEPLIERKITLRKSTSDAIDKYLYDPVTGKPKYGEMSRLIESLIRQHLKEVKNITFDDLLENENGNGN